MNAVQPLSILGRSPAPAPAFSEIPVALRNAPVDAVYVHVPFCATKCHYCDFYSFAGHLDRAPEFIIALTREIRIREAFFGVIRPRTLFIGGGTPTLLPPTELQHLLATLNEHIDLSILEEFTVEANPNTFDATKARILAAHGVNRISFGAQSFHPSELRTLQRDHDPENVPPAFAIARAAGISNLNIDLIFGIPGQTVKSWDASLARALELEPSHMSCYSLTYEANTAMTARLNRGEFERIDEETELAMFEHVFRRLRAAGFVRYETSNFARAGKGAERPEICRHNLHYWKAANWLGLGPSAGSHMAREGSANDSADDSGAIAYQWKNVGSLAHYVEALSEGVSRGRVPVSQIEALTRSQWAAGAAVFWLRLAEGLNYDEFRARTGVDPQPILRQVLGPFMDQGFAEVTDSAARILDRGVPVSNHILARVLAAFESHKQLAKAVASCSGSGNTPS